MTWGPQHRRVARALLDTDLEEKVDGRALYEVASIRGVPKEEALEILREIAAHPTDLAERNAQWAHRVAPKLDDAAWDGVFCGHWSDSLTAILAKDPVRSDDVCGLLRAHARRLSDRLTHEEHTVLRWRCDYGARRLPAALHPARKTLHRCGFLYVDSTRTLPLGRAVLRAVDRDAYPGGEIGSCG